MRPSGCSTCPHPVTHRGSSLGCQTLSTKENSVRFMILAATSFAKHRQSLGCPRGSWACPPPLFITLFQSGNIVFLLISLESRGCVSSQHPGHWLLLPLQGSVEMLGATRNSFPLSHAQNQGCFPIIVKANRCNLLPWRRSSLLILQ